MKPSSVTHTLRSVATRAPRKARAELRALRRRRHLVSVVVPVYNVEKYVAECLDSILAQTHPRLEVLVVDDGSPDSSIAIVESIARRDKRIRIIHQENGGLGAARNTGARHARGEFLWFVDSDDVVPPRAAEVMLESLLESGSDFAVGSLVRWDSTGTHTPPWAKRVHAETVQGRTVSDDVEILKDVFAWNKLFRREFFLRVVKEYPAGVYEDQVPSAKAYLGGTFDVLSDVVYHWRVRDDTSSITQQKATIEDLSGRWGVIDALHDAMAHAPEHVRRSWQAKVIGFDMRLYYEQIPRTDETYWDFLSGRVRGFLDDAGYDVIRDVLVADRPFVSAVYQGYRDDIARLVVRRETQTWKVPGVVQDGRPVLAPEFFEGLDLEPDDVVSDLSVDVEVVAHTDTVVIDESTVRVRGSAYLSFIDLARAERTEIAVTAVSSGGHEIGLAVQRHDDPETERRAGDPWNDHLASGFAASIAISELDPTETYRFAVSVTVDGLVRSAPLEVPDPRGEGRLPAFGPLTSDGRWCVERQEGSQELAVRRISPGRIPVLAARVSGSEVELELAATPAPGTSFRATSGVLVSTGKVETRGGRSFVRFDLQVGSRVAWGLRPWKLVGAQGGVTRRLAWTEASTAVARDDAVGLVLGATQYGNVLLSSGRVTGQVTSLALTDDGLEVRGWLRGQRETPGAVLQLSGKAGEVSAPVTAGRDGRFVVHLPVNDRGGNPLSTSFGFVVKVDVDGQELWLPASRTLLDTFPLDLENSRIAATVTSTPGAGAAWVRFRARFAGDERSRRDQARMIEEYRAGSAEPLDAVLFETFSGRTAGDSPLALSVELHRSHPDLGQYWSVATTATPVPEWATPVLRHSREWFRVLGGARYLVNNANWPWFFVKKEHQFYLQTWHGTPLKKIGNDVPGASLSLSYRELMVREAEAWDVLLAQNTYSAEIFPNAFDYRGPVLVEGYPRNDSLFGPEAADVRRRLRESFGIEDDVRVLLYAPTWRDNLKGAGGYGRVTYLDFDAVVADAAVTGRRTVVLYRGHSNTAGSAATLPPEVIDVTSYPDVNDLMLASDALVTDYSSIMFDYAVTRKPIYFLVPDLALYSSTTRGFYRDLTVIAPGPLCASTGEVLAALVEDYEALFRERYERFVAEFTPYDDGHASRRVLARVPGLSSSSAPAASGRASTS